MPSSHAWTRMLKIFKNFSKNLFISLELKLYQSQSYNYAIILSLKCLAFNICWLIKRKFTKRFDSESCSRTPAVISATFRRTWTFEFPSKWSVHLKMSIMYPTCGIKYTWVQLRSFPPKKFPSNLISSLSLFPYLSAVFSDLASPDPPLHFSPLFASIFKYNIKVGIMENNAKLLRFKTKYKKKKNQSNLSPVWLRCSITDVCWCRLIINWHTFPFLQRHDGFTSGRLWCRAILRYAAS